MIELKKTHLIFAEVAGMNVWFHFGYLNASFKKQYSLIYIKMFPYQI